MARRSVHAEQLALFDVRPAPGRRRRARYVHVHTPAELAGFARSIENSMRIRGDAPRGVPHLHFVLGHTTALEKAFARAFFRELKAAAYAHGLGHTTMYEKAVPEQGKYEARRLRN